MVGGVYANAARFMISNIPILRMQNGLCYQLFELFRENRLRREQPEVVPQSLWNRKIQGRGTGDRAGKFIPDVIRLAGIVPPLQRKNDAIQQDVPMLAAGRAVAKRRIVGLLAF